MKKFVLLLFLVPLIVNAQTKHPQSARKLYTKATDAYANGNDAEALNLFKQCVSEDPTYSEAYLNMSIIYFHQKDYPNAIANSRNAYQYNKFQPYVYSQYGKCLFYTGDFDSSVICLNKAIDLGSTEELDYIYLGKAQLNIGDNESAIENLSKAIEINDKNPVSYSDRGNAYFNTGQYELAEADYLKVLELLPNSNAIYSNLANVAVAQDNPEKAIGYIDAALVNANSDEKVQLLIVKGNYYHSIGELDSATMSFDEAYKLDSENAIVLTNQAAVMIDQENYQGAISKCNLALEIQPEMMEAYYNRGIANEMIRNVQEACIDWEQAFILGSEKAEIYLNSAICNE